MGIVKDKREEALQRALRRIERFLRRRMGQAAYGQVTFGIKWLGGVPETLEIVDPTQRFKLDRDEGSDVAGDEELG